MRSFATRTSLMAHQAEAVAKVLPSRVSALFMDMGTGKTRTVIELARIRAGKIDRVVWFCPVSLRETIRQEIRKHTDCPDAEIVVFDDRTNQRNVNREALWVVVGIETMSTSTRVTLTVNSLITDKTFIVVDESSYIKGHRSMRTQRITRLSETGRYRTILTGTPMTQGVVDLYAQMRFLSPKILGYRSFYSFAANHLEYSEKFPGMIVRAHNTEWLAAKIQPYVYQVRAQDCLDLPEKHYATRYCRLTARQEEAYRTAKIEILSEYLSDEDFSSIAIFRLFTALQSIVCGFWTRRRADHPVEHLTFPTTRLDVLMDTVAEIAGDEKVIIWAKYRHCVEEICAELSEAYGEEAVVAYYGDIPDKKRDPEIERWRKSGRFLVATQSLGGHGLTLNEARYVIFYGNAFKYSERDQAERRCHRIGQERNVIYIDVHCSGTIDDRIWESLSKKENALKAFRREVEKVKGKGMKEKVRGMVMGL